PVDRRRQHVRAGSVLWRRAGDRGDAVADRARARGAAGVSHSAYVHRHCERSEAIHAPMDRFVASLLAMTVQTSQRLDNDLRRDLSQLEILALARAIDHQEIA